MSQDTSRRSVLKTAAAAGISLAAASPGIAQANARARSSGTAPTPPDLSFLRDMPLADAEKLRTMMDAAGLDAIIASKPANVFYLTNHWPQLDRMGMEGSGLAIFCRDPSRPLALVMHAFLYYYTHSPESGFGDRQIFTFTQPAGAGAGSGTDGEPPAQAARTMRVIDATKLTPLDRHRFDTFARTNPPSADASWALKKAIRALGLNNARIGVDDSALVEVLGSRGFEGTTSGAENVIRRTRLSKSPAELRLMRFAAQANVDAAMAAANQARRLGSSRRLRAQFFAEAALRGNDGHFMVVGGTSTEALDQPFIEGTSVSIDCVSTCRYYHGDFGRTIFIGEPPANVRRAAGAVATAWQEIREQLRPGMRFADIPRIGRESLQKQGADLTVSFTPHSVGLFHTDHPQPSLILPRVAEDLVLEENMVLSVDCPVFLAGLGGTIHLEDLMLIKDGRAEPIHTIPPPIITV